MAEECLSFHARRLSRALTRQYDDVLRPVGIHASQLMLLNAIALSGEGGAGMGGMADFLVMDRTTLSRNLRPLAKAGLVRLSRSPHDARTRLALLTPDGERLMAQAFPLWERAHRRMVSALGPKKASELRDRFAAAVVAAGGSDWSRLLRRLADRPHGPLS